MTITAQDLVNREVQVCMSSLVSTLADGYAHNSGSLDHTEIRNLAEQAFELASPIDDWEEAAIQAGWSRRVLNGDVEFFQENDSQASAYADTWQGLCEEVEIEPYTREVFEHWAVSEWFGEKLQAKGEKVDFDFAGLVVWARTTTGQGIASDSIVEAICAELNRA